MTSDASPGDRKFAHGLVLGKFFPPHCGHAFLVRSALQFCDKVTIGVFDHESSALPLAVRAAALAEMAAPFDNYRVVWAEDRVPVDYESVEVWDQHMAIFRAAIALALQREGTTLQESPLSAVFTSEMYGTELARRFGCVHVQVDRARTWQPVSGTMIRAAPHAHWGLMPTVVQEHLARRVVCLGAESTGTTTLANALADSMRKRKNWCARPVVVPEFGREYTMQKLAVQRAQRGEDAQVQSLAWHQHEFVHVANVQSYWEAQAVRTAGPLVVCDTDALATQVWHERYVGGRCAGVDKEIDKLKGDRLYLLTHHEGVPFVDDGMRDGEGLRGWMTARFEAVLKERGARYLVLRGTEQQRLDAAMEATEKFMAQEQTWL